MVENFYCISHSTGLFKFNYYGNSSLVKASEIKSINLTQVSCFHFLPFKKFIVEFYKILAPSTFSFYISVKTAEAATKAKALKKPVIEFIFLNKVTGLSPVTLLKNEIFHRYFQEFC